MERISRLFLGLLLLAAMPMAFALPAPNVSWQFDNNLNEDNGGSPISLVNTAAIGSNSSYAADTINGVAANTLEFNSYANGDALQVLTGFAANGATTATRVNQYTVVMDLKIMAGSWPIIFETAHSDGDAEIFYQGGNSSLGRSSNNYFRQTSDTLQNRWMRLAITVDMMNKVSKLYVNGQMIGVFASTHGNVSGGQDGRMALTAGPAASFWLFGEDNFDGDQTGEQGRINSLACYNSVLSPDDIELLGGPSATGIPTSVPSRPITLVKNSTMWGGNIYGASTYPIDTGDLTSYWANDHTWMDGIFGFVNYYNARGVLKIRHLAGNFGHPHIEVNTSPTLALSSDIECVLDLAPLFNTSRSLEVVTIMMCDPAPADTNMTGNYSNAEFAVRLGHAGETLGVQCGGSQAAIDSSSQVPLTGVTVSTLTSFQVVITHHDGAYYAYYAVNGEPTAHAFPNTPIVKARTKTALRLTSESFFQSGYNMWDLLIDQIRVYSGFQTVPVELSTFAAE